MTGAFCVASRAFEHRISSGAKSRMMEMKAKGALADSIRSRYYGAINKQNDRDSCTFCAIHIRVVQHLGTSYAFYAQEQIDDAKTPTGVRFGARLVANLPDDTEGKTKKPVYGAS